MHNDPIPRAALDDAVMRGVLTAEQRAAVVAIAAEWPAREVAPPRGPRIFDGPTLAYGAGAAAVLFAMGWFLADRWNALGPWGVLAIVAGYALVFLGVARVLRREGFGTAADVAVVLAVCTTAVMAWALQKALGLWPDIPGACRWDSGAVAWCNQGWIVVELVVLLAALVALRHVPSALLTVPIAVALLFLLRHVVDAVRGSHFDQSAEGWSLVIGASLMATLAYFVDRRSARDAHDYGAALWSAAVVAAVFAAGTLWGTDTGVRHALPWAGLVAAIAALSLRRRVVLWFGAGCMLWYLGWLAFEVFDDVVAFPIALAMAGIAVIVATVVVQRQFPALVQRLRLRDPDGRRVMPGGYASLLAPAFLALLVLPAAMRDDADRRETQRVREQLWRRRAHRENMAARARQGTPGQAGPSSKPRPATRETAPRRGA